MNEKGDKQEKRNSDQNDYFDERRSGGQIQGTN